MSPSQIVLNSAQTIDYLACTDGLMLLDSQTGSIIERIPAGWNTQTVALNAAETTAYTINLTDGTPTVIDLPARMIKTVIKLGQFAYGVTVDPDGTRAYVNALDSIVVVSLSTAEIITAVPVTRVVDGRVHLNKAGTLGFTVAGHDGKSPAGGILHVIKLSTNTVVGTALVAPSIDAV